MIVLGIACQSGNDKTFLIKVGLSQNPEEPQVRAFRLFKEIVEEKTAGKIRVEIYPNNQLGNQRDITEGIQLGMIQINLLFFSIIILFPKHRLSKFKQNLRLICDRR